MKRALGVGLRSVEESTMASARMLDWDTRAAVLQTRTSGVRAHGPLIRLGSEVRGTRVAWHVV